MASGCEVAASGTALDCIPCVVQKQLPMQNLNPMHYSDSSRLMLDAQQHKKLAPSSDRDRSEQHKRLVVGPVLAIVHNRIRL